MEGLLVIGGLGILGYNVIYGGGDPKPQDGAPPGASLPPPKFLYSEPRIWSSAPVDITYRNYMPYYGPLNDPRRAYILYGGSRVPFSGYNPVVGTNLVWDAKASMKKSGVPEYTPNPIRGLGEKQIVTTSSVFKD